MVIVYGGIFLSTLWYYRVYPTRRLFVSVFFIVTLYSGGNGTRVGNLSTRLKTTSMSNKVLHVWSPAFKVGIAVEGVAGKRLMMYVVA